MFGVSFLSPKNEVGTPSAVLAEVFKVGLGPVQVGPGDADCFGRGPGFESQLGDWPTGAAESRSSRATPGPEWWPTSRVPSGGRVGRSRPSVNKGRACEQSG
ncbi:hypothetical protein NL676_002935 [Syzygium grande]|nr:hypothetical protein NL676_002935 [Syzygium grande]